MNKPRCMRRFLKSFWAMCLAVSTLSLKQGSAKGEGGVGLARGRFCPDAPWVTPSARLAAAIELLSALEAQCFAPDARRRPADAVASDFFRARRFIGGGDRRSVSEWVWG